MSRAVTISRRTLLKALAAGGVGLAAGAGALYVSSRRRHVELTRTTLPIHHLPPGLSGLRVGLITDVHRSRWVSHDDVIRAVELLNSARPDIIFLGGDYVTWGDRQYVGPSAEALASLSAPHGVYGILGNHDDAVDMPGALAARGIQMLKNARTRLTIRHETIEIVGISFWTRRETDIASLVRGAAGPVVLLAHDPRRVLEAAHLNIPLVLSGHTHGGQVVLPVVGAVAARKFPVVSGTARRGETTIFVSRGVGTVYVPVRVNCPPEVAVLTLQHAGSVTDSLQQSATVRA
jgi:predicted MPP superfamily phosphohydrolase